MKNSKHDNDHESKKSIYSNFNITEKGADIIVISLSAILILFLVIAIITG